MGDTIETQPTCYLLGDEKKMPCSFPGGQFCGLCNIGKAVEKILLSLSNEYHSVRFLGRIYVINNVGVTHVIALGQAMTSLGEKVIIT